MSGLEQEREQIGCILMASGNSRRFGRNKLLADFHGKTLFERALELTKELRWGELLVLTRSEEVQCICEQQKVPVLRHTLSGRNEAVRLGIEQMQTMDACLFCPCDQPLLCSESLKRLVEAYRENGKGIFRLSYGERSGAPVLFSWEFFKELRELPQGRGGSWLAEKYPQQIRNVSAKEAWELWDVDTPADYERLLNVVRKEKCACLQ